MDSMVEERLHVMDLSGDGFIDALDLEVLLRAKGIALDTGRILEILDTNEDGLISYEEVRSFLTLSNLLVVFDALDEDKNGSIDASELRHAFKSQLGLDLSQEELRDLLSALDSSTDPDGLISFTEFAQFFGQMISATSGVKDLLDYLKSHGSSYDVGNGFSPSTGSLTSNSALNSIVRTWVAGAAGGLVSRSLMAPLDLIMIVQQTTGAKVSQVYAQVKKRNGWKGLYRGNGAGLLKTIPFSGIVCASYVPLVGQINDDSPWAWYQRVLAGAAAGFIATIVTHPLDTARARLAVSARNHHESLLQVLRRGGYYRGLRTTLVTMSLFIGIQQAAYDRLKFDLRPSNGLEFFGAGIIAGTVASAVTHPLDTIRRTLQVHSSREYVTSRQIARDLYKKAGIRGFYRGFIPNAIKLAPSVGLALIVRDYVLGRI